MVIKDLDDLTTPEYLSLLINYLKVLQDGRTLPNKNPNVSGAYIRESVHNIDEIASVKEKINDVLRINRVPKSVEFEVVNKPRVGATRYKTI